MQCLPAVLLGILLVACGGRTRDGDEPPPPSERAVADTCRTLCAEVERCTDDTPGECEDGCLELALEGGAACRVATMEWMGCLLRHDACSVIEGSLQVCDAALEAGRNACEPEPEPRMPEPFVDGGARDDYFSGGCRSEFWVEYEDVCGETLWCGRQRLDVECSRTPDGGFSCICKEHDLRTWEETVAPRESAACDPALVGAVCGW